MGTEDAFSETAAPHVSHASRVSFSSSSTEPMPEWRVIACALAMCGIQVCYAAQINMGTAELLLLGVSERVVSLAWLAGPLSGLLVQPLVGYASDACTSSLGRRRPFLIAGSIFTTLALLLFSNALDVAAWLAPPETATRLALSIAIFAFFLLDFSIQAIQAPLRALVTDVVPRRQRAHANAYIGVFTGLGNLIGGVLTALDLSVLLPVFPNDIQALFTIAAVVLIFTVAICVLATPETPLHPTDYEALFGDAATDDLNYDGSPQRASHSSDSDSGSSLLMPTSTQQESESTFGSIVTTLKGIPRPFWQVFGVQLCTWVGFFTLFVYVNTWVGRNVYLGNGSAPKGSPERVTFEKGIKLGGQGNALTAIVTLAYSLALPRLLERFGTTAVYSFSQIVEAACLLCAPLLRGVPGQILPSLGLRFATLVDIGLFGVVWATTMGVPWTLVGNALDSDPWYAQRVGLFTTLFNASQSFPQLIVAFMAPVILSIVQNDIAWVMFSGGVCAAIGALLVVFLKVDVFEGEDLEVFGEEED